MAGHCSYAGNITSEAQLAAAMHSIALAATTDADLIQNAVGEAGLVFVATGNADAAIAAGHARIHGALNQSPLESACERLWSSWWFIGWLGACVALMFVARIAGWWL